ncbi:unnamed protein product [Tenebrio molitor]|nr:unnamed protein product [Tenebrio molitor]
MFVKFSVVLTYYFSFTCWITFGRGKCPSSNTGKNSLMTIYS